LLKKIKEHRVKHQKLTKRMKDIDKEKGRMIEEADIPVEGLSFNEEGIFINGIPFEQESSSKQLKVSMHMAMALNPKLRVLLVKDGSLLDKDSIKEIEKVAKENDFQMWVEKVGEDEEIGIIIEDGGVKQ